MVKQSRASINLTAACMNKNVYLDAFSYIKNNKLQKILLYQEQV
jgi:hypothetical protein